MVVSRFTHNSDVRIHYLDSGGDDHGAPIVFVPGMTDVADDYIEVLPLFGRRTTVVEVRGHGESGAPASGYDLAMLSADVGAVVDAVTDGPVHVVTFSRGTSAAIAWALDHSDRVRSLAIGDYVPEEKVLAPDLSRRLLNGRWRGTPVSERLNMDAGVKTFQAAAEPVLLGRACRDFDFRCSWFAVANVSLSATTNGRATSSCSRMLNWLSSTTRLTTYSGRTGAATLGSFRSTSTARTIARNWPRRRPPATCARSLCPRRCLRRPEEQCP